jgi:hypothetical protein
VVTGEDAASESLVERYEELRRRALGGEPDGWRLGLAVLQRQGVAAWMQVWDGIAPAAGERGSSPPPEHCNELVSVLACMALGVAGG